MQSDKEKSLEIAGLKDKDEDRRLLTVKTETRRIRGMLKEAMDYGRLYKERYFGMERES